MDKTTSASRTKPSAAVLISAERVVLHSSKSPRRKHIPIGKTGLHTRLLV